MAEYRLDFDFVAIPLELFRSGLDSSAIAAYAGIRSLSRYQEDGVKATDGEAGRAAGMSDRAFRDARARLRAAGWLTWQRTGRENIYTVQTIRLTHGITEVRSADSAEQIGAGEPSDRQDPPSTTSREKPTDSKEKKDLSPAEPATTWLTPYLDVHQKHVGAVTAKGKVNPGRLAASLKPVHDEAGAEKALALFTRFCLSDKSDFGPEWFAANWKKADRPVSGKRAAPPATYDQSGNDAATRALEAQP